MSSKPLQCASCRTACRPSSHGLASITTPWGALHKRSTPSLLMKQCLHHELSSTSPARWLERSRSIVRQPVALLQRRHWPLTNRAPRSAAAIPLFSGPRPNAFTARPFSRRCFRLQWSDPSPLHPDTTQHAPPLILETAAPVARIIMPRSEDEVVAAGKFHFTVLLFSNDDLHCYWQYAWLPGWVSKS